MRPPKLFPDVGRAAHAPVAMHGELRAVNWGDSGRRGLPLSRTVPLLIGLLVAMVPGAASEQEETLVEMISVELEASMQSSVLSELHAAAASVGEGPSAALPDRPAKTGAVYGGVPDSSALVGQAFQLKIPSGPTNASCDVSVSTPKNTQEKHQFKGFDFVKRQFKHIDAKH